MLGQDSSINEPARFSTLPRPLSTLSPGEEAVVLFVDGGRGFTKRLVEMGFVPGVRVRVLFSPNPGSRIVEVMGARIALSVGILSKVYVG